MKLPTIYKINSTLAILALSVTGFISTPNAVAGTPDKTVAVVTPPPAESKLHALLQFDFSDAYITPRGLVVTDQGMAFQPLFLVFWTPYSNKDAFLTDVTLTLGVWSDFDTVKGGADPAYWNEFDPIAGLSFKFAKYWTFETNFTAFKSMTESYSTSEHLEFKLKFDDSKLLGAFSLSPYVAFWQELNNKATVVFDPATSSEGSYFTLGINPSFKVKDIKFEFPTYINLVSDNFYQQFDGSDGGSGLAVFGTEFKVSAPLKFIPKDMGFWSIYAGVKYYHFNNLGLEDGNIALTNTDQTNVVQVHGGISIFF